MKEEFNYFLIRIIVFSLACCFNNSFGLAEAACSAPAGCIVSRCVSCVWSFFVFNFPIPPLLFLPRSVVLLLLSSENEIRRGESKAKKIQNRKARKWNWISCSRPRRSPAKAAKKWKKKIEEKTLSRRFFSSIILVFNFPALALHYLALRRTEIDRFFCATKNVFFLCFMLCFFLRQFASFKIKTSN